jgi:hypothetical protein
MSNRKVSTSKELLAALDDAVTEITVTGTLLGMGSLRLSRVCAWREEPSRSVLAASSSAPTMPSRTSVSRVRPKR